jgi:poly-gamma-glutamate synthesis protein (capsule biosynthesis protein)
MNILLAKTLISTVTALSLISSQVQLPDGRVENPDVVKEVDTDSITISFAGDCTLGNYKGQGYSNSFNEMLSKTTPDYFFSNVKEIFENDDITFVNLEGALTNETQKVDKTYPIKGNVEGIQMLQSASIEAVNLANNHIYDCGQAGFNECVNLLEENNISYCGEGYTAIYEIPEKDVKVGFLGYRAFSITTELKNNIKNDIENLRTQGADVICVMFHYGTEGTHVAGSDQINISRYAVDQGADIVMGGHPHVLQGIEVYNGKVIDYSLGNFCFGANKNPKDKDTIIFQQTFTKDENGAWVYGESTVIPCSISSTSTRNDYKPTPLTDTAKDRVISNLKSYSSKFNDTIEMLK